jgi:hypothetical protein
MKCLILHFYQDQNFPSTKRLETEPKNIAVLYIRNINLSQKFFSPSSQTDKTSLSLYYLCGYILTSMVFFSLFHYYTAC